VNIGKRYFFAFVLIGLVVIGIVGVVAWNADSAVGTPNVFGHSMGEIDWAQTIRGNVTVAGNVNVSINVTAAAFCIQNATGKYCTNSWVTGLGSQWQNQISSNNIYYNVSGGNVGIGTGTPSQKLNVVGDTNITGNLVVGGITKATGGLVIQLVGSQSAEDSMTKTAGQMWLRTDV